MKKLLAGTFVLLSILSCSNSPEGSTNTEGSGSGVLPDKTGDTSNNNSGNSGGGIYSTDTMPGQGRNKGSDSNVLVTEDSVTMKMNTVEKDSIKKNRQ